MAGAIGDHVLVQLTIDSVGLARQGFGVPMILSHNASFIDRVRYYTSITAVGDDFATDSPEYLAARAMFAQRPKPRRIAIGRAVGTLTQRYDISLVTAAVGQEYAIGVVGEGVTTTTVSYTALADITFVDGDVNTTSDLVTKTGHGMTSGDGPYRLKNTGGALPTGLAADTNYLIYAPTANTFGFAISKANAIAGTPLVDITAAAGGGTHTRVRGQNDVIIAQLVQGLNAVTGANYSATQIAGAGETDTLRVTGSDPNNWFSLTINTPIALSIEQTHDAPSDVTLATDLANILLADQGWYCLITLYNSTAYTLAAAAWVESNDRIYVYDDVNTDAITTVLSGATDAIAQMSVLGRARTMGAYHPNPSQFLAAAWMGRWLPTDPGKATPKFKTLSGITPPTLTDTNKTNLRARRGNAYEQVTADRPFTWEGTVFSTVFKFLDITRNADWLTDGASKVLLGVLVGTDIVPHTIEGIALLEGALRGFIRGEAVTQGVLSGTPLPEVSAPAIEDITSADKEARNLSQLRFDGTFAGAIHQA